MRRKRDGRYGLAAWTADFEKDRGLMSGYFVNQAGTGCSEGTQMFFTPYISCSLRLLKLKTEGQIISQKASVLQAKNGLVSRLKSKLLIILS